MNENETSPVNDVKIQNLKASSLRGGSITVGTQALKFLLQTGSTIVLARILLPADFGLVAMVSSLLGFVYMFVDFGLSTATIQKKTISQEEMSGLFYINLLIGLLILIILFACAPLVASFYGNPDAKNITLAFGWIALVNCAGAQHSALIERQMRFGTLAICGLSAMTIGVFFGIITAVMGAGFWALIIMQVAHNTSYTLFLWFGSGWRPGNPKHTPGLKGLVKFGGTLTISNMLTYANNNINNILLGKFLGEVAVGYYSKAHGLVNRPVSQVLPPIMRVATPLFSRLAQHRERFVNASMTLIEITCFVSCILPMLALPTSDWIIHLVLGDQWTQTIPVFRVLVLFGFLEPLSRYLGTILVAAGKPDAMVKWRSITIILVVISFVAGLPWGILGVAVGYTASGIVSVFWLLFFAGKRIGIPGLNFIKACAPFVLAASAISAGLWILRTKWVPESMLMGFVSYSLIGLICYIAVLASAPKGRRFLRGLISLGMDTWNGFRTKDPTDIPS